jgi:tetratricopeptide (TPR) repeat protein
VPVPLDPFRHGVCKWGDGVAATRGYRFICPVEDEPDFGSTHSPSAVYSASRLAYVTGRYLWSRRTVRDVHASVECFERALGIEHDSAVAYSGLADANVILGIWGLQRADRAFGAARRAARRALTLDPRRAEAHTSFAEVLTGYEWDWPQAERHYGHAISLNRAYATAHHWYAQLLASLRRYPEAIWHIEQARSADPVSPAINAYLPQIYLAARDYDRARVEAQRAVDLEPHSPLAHWQLGRAYLFSNDGRRAVATLECAASLAGRASMWEAELSFAQARAGNTEGATRLLSGLMERARREYVSPYDLAIAFAGIRDYASALDQLEQAFAQRVMRIVAIGDPEFDTLAAEPRYRRLGERLRLPVGSI